MDADTITTTSKLIDYGVLGIFCVLLIAALAYLHRAHERERREWREAHEQERKEWKETVETQFTITNNTIQKMVDVTSRFEGFLRGRAYWSGGSEK